MHGVKVKTLRLLNDITTCVAPTVAACEELTVRTVHRRQHWRVEHHRSLTDWPGIEPGLEWKEVGDLKIGNMARPVIDAEILSSTLKYYHHVEVKP
jgi:hypothetical protein